MTDDTILTAIETVRADLLAESAEHGHGRSPRRYLWCRAEDGWVLTRDLHDPQMTPAERQRLSRLIRGMLAAGQLEATYDAGGRVIEVRVPPAPKARRAKR